MASPAIAACTAGQDDPGTPAVKVPVERLPEAARLTFDEASYRVLTRALHRTTVVVAVHRDWETAAGVPTPAAFADLVFGVFDLHWHVFCGYPFDRFLVIVRPPSDASETLNTRAGFVVTGEKNHAAFRQASGVIPHDVFHVWLRQIVFADTTGGAAGAVAPEAWFYEGVTAYYQHRAFAALGDQAAYFRGMNAHRGTYARLRGGAVDVPFAQLAAQAGPPAPPNNQALAMLDAKGALVAYLLERALLVTGRNLDDLLQHLYREFGLRARGFRTADVEAALGTMGGGDFSRFFARYVAGADRLPLVGRIDLIDHDTNEVTDPGNPATKTTLVDSRLPRGYLDVDEGAYHLYSLSIHGTRVVVAIHRSLDGVTHIGGQPTPAREEFARQMFDAFEEFWHVFGGFPYDRFVVKIQALADPQRFVGASWQGFVLSAAGMDLTQTTGPPHWYTDPMFREAPVHEMFHAWNGGVVQTVLRGRADSAGPFYEETFLVEGFTDYYDIRAIHSTGRADLYARKMQIARDGYVSRLGTDVDLAFAGLAGRANVAFGAGNPPNDASSLMIWKGTLVGYLLDRALVARGRSLDDLMRELYERFGLPGRGFRTPDVIEALRAIGGGDFQDFFDRHVVGNERLPLPESFEHLDRETLPPRLSVGVNQPVFRTGERHTATLAIRAGGAAAATGDLYLAVVTPTRAILFFDGRGFTAGPAAAELGAGSVDVARTVVSLPVPSGLPAGRYLWAAALVRTNAPPLDPASWLAIATAPFNLE